MVSLITVLNDSVEQFVINLIYVILAHLVCLTTVLHESFINLSVLIHLVCLITVPNGFISSDYLFHIVCLFSHVWSVSLQYCICVFRLTIYWGLLV